MIILELLGAMFVGVLTAPIEVTAVLSILMILLFASIMYNDIKR